MESGLSTNKGTPERAKIVEEIFRKYHKQLINWCKFKLLKRNPADTLGIDAEDVVAYVYQGFLSHDVTVDLNRSESEIRGLLNISLDYAIGHFLVMKKAKRRNPEGGEIISLDELLEEKDEENLPLKLKQFLGKDANLDAKIYIRKALALLEETDKKKADIIRKRFFMDKTLEEVSDEYGQTRENIRQLEIRALRKLRIILSREGEKKESERIITGETMAADNTKTAGVGEIPIVPILKEENKSFEPSDRVKTALKYLEQGSILLEDIPAGILNSFEIETFLLGVERSYSSRFINTVLKQKGYTFQGIDELSPDSNKLITKMICQTILKTIEKARPYIAEVDKKEFEKRADSFVSFSWPYF